jgi:hypothetical protein
MQNWKMEFNWIKTHTGHHWNELAEQLEKEVATSREYEYEYIECYKRIPKSSLLRELNDDSITKWQSVWDHPTKGAIMK